MKKAARIAVLGEVRSVSTPHRSNDVCLGGDGKRCLLCDSRI